jgi:hypothetical protein
LAETTEPAGIPSPHLAVIGTGFGRTGTLSLREALERLGFAPCDHMLENFEHPERFARWREAVERKQRGEPIDWRPLLGGYRAIVDWPGAWFWKELVAAHPDAKVILTVRDPARWYESTLATIFGVRARADESPLARAAMRLLGAVIPGMREGFQVVDDVIWEGTFGGRFADREHALRVYADHIRDVQATVPADRLLVFDVREGWGPLCAFLGVPVPAGESFPHVNDAASFQQRIQGRFAQELLARARPIAAAVAVLGALFWMARRARRGETME